MEDDKQNIEVEGEPEDNNRLEQEKLEQEDEDVQFRVETEKVENNDNSEARENEEIEPEMIEIEKSNLKDLKEERAELKEKYLRRTADLKNLKDRTRQEKQDLMKYANDSLLADIIEVIDNFDRALEQMDFENDEMEKGVHMIKSQLDDLLEKYNVEPMNADGKPFDPHSHEGMMREEREELDEKIVLEVFKKGFKLYDRVLRPAAVKVGIPASDADKEQKPENTED